MVSHDLEDRFNSTTVQLIRKGYLPLLDKTVFQFHNGTINTLGQQAKYESAQ